MSLPPRGAPVLAAAVMAIAFLVVDPPTVDLVAHEFRADLFGREGFTIWNGNWYGGHHTPAYSVLFPPLGWLLSPNLVGALAAVAAAALFEPLARAHFGERARWGALWFGIGVTSNLFTGRMPFALGVALGLGALLAVQRERLAPAAALAVLCSLASPVAGLFLGLAAAAVVLGGQGARSAGVVLGVAALVPIAALAVAFPEGGREPFVLSAFLPVPLFVVACALVLPRAERTLLAGAVLFGLLNLVALALDTPVGGNATRLGALVGGPLLLCVVLSRGAGRLPAAAVAAGLAALAVWQWVPAVRDTTDALGDPAAEAYYYQPVARFLEAAAPLGGRVEVVFTHAHREAEALGRDFALARGWQRQLDVERNALFYEGDLTDERYQRWLQEQAVRFVALPDSDLDNSAKDEARLVARDPPYLALRERTEHWRIYEVTPRPALVAPARGTRVTLSPRGSDRFVLDFATAGSALARVRFSPYWRAAGGCVERAGEWTRVSASRAGRVEVSMRFGLGRVVSRGRRC